MAIGRISGQMLKANLQRSGVDLAFETDLLVLDVTNSYVGIGTATPSRQLHISGTGAIRLPSGSDAQRGTAANGDIRYNTDQGYIEGYSNGGWTSLVGEGLDNIVEDTTPQLGGNLDVNGQEITSAGNGNVTINPAGAGIISIGSNILPDTTTTYNLGSADYRFNELWLASNTIDLGGTKLSIDESGNFEVKDPDGTLKAVVADSILVGTGANKVKISRREDGKVRITDESDVDTSIFTVVGDDSTGTDFNTGETFQIAGGTGITTAVSGDTLTITGPDLSTYVQTDGNVQFGTVTATSDVTIGGNLTVTGTTTTIESSTLTIEDPMIQLAKNNSGGAANAFDQGLFFNRGSLDNVSFLWDESADEFVVAVTSGEDGTTAGNVTLDSYANFRAGTVTANLTGDVTGDVTGNLTSPPQKTGDLTL